MSAGRAGAAAAGRAPESDRLARAALSRLAEPGDPRVAALVADLGAAEVVAWLREGHELGGLLADAAPRVGGVDPALDLERAERLGIRFVVPGDEEWPADLGDLATAPPLHRRGGVPLGLWVRGPLPLSRATGGLAVVGSRSATSYGTTVAAAIAAVAAGAGHCVASGAAFGIDQAAHRGALARGLSVAVLACGVDRAYPTAHADLLARLGEVGAVVSEAPPGCAPTRVRFLARNRLIAALCRGTVVVEAAIRSGALNTASWAELVHRVVMGVPGPVTSATSQGVHQLIRTGGATLVTCGEDVLELVADVGEHLVAPPRAEPGPRDGLTLREQQVLDAVPVHAAAALDSVARSAGIDRAAVAGVLTRLRDRGLVEANGSAWRLAPAARPR